MNTESCDEHAPPVPVEDRPTASSSNAVGPQSARLPRKVSETLLAAVQEFSSAMRAEYGVNVRDFAYESTLPPVLVVPHIPVQVQPGINSLKRTRRFYEEDGDDPDPPGQYTFYIDSDSVGSSHGTRGYKESKPIERTPTEPVGDTEHSNEHPLRSIGLAPLSQPQGRNPAVAGPSTPHRRRLQIPGISRSSPPLLEPDAFPSQATGSQDTEPWIDTPLVTPNGSLQWNVQDTSAISASQLGAASQLPVPGEDVTLSQLGFSSERSQTRATLDSSPARSAPGASSLRCLSLTASSCANRSSSPLPESPLREGAEESSGKSADETTGDAMPENQVPRYHLRDRPSAPTRSSARANKRARGAQTAVAHEAAAVRRSSPVKTSKSPSTTRPTRRSARIGQTEPGAVS